jgi:hypothetical protein
MGSSTLLAQLPVLLIATASVLLDQSFRKELVRDRLSCQVWLWLAVSLSPPSEEQHVLFHAWVHAVIFSNILSTVASWKLTSWEPLGRLLAPSAWITMTITLALPNGASSDASESMGVYLLSFAVLWASQWHMQRKKRIGQTLQGIPSTRSDVCMQRFGLKAAPPDEREWINWRQSQVLQWMSATLDDEDANIVTSVLAPERIPGSILETLSVQQLLQLNVPYGPACLLSRHIERLVRTHPPQRTTTSGVYVSSSPRASAIPAGRYERASVPNLDEEESIPEPLLDWLTLHDQQYNHPKSDHASRPNTFPIKSYHADPVTESFTFEGSEQQRRMEDMMMERYGLELPKLRTPNEMQASPAKDEYPPAATFNYARAPASAPVAPPAKDPLAPVPITKEDVMAAIPPLIFNQMPPHIQEIAKRNPDLVQQLMGATEQETIPPPDSAVASNKLAWNNAHQPTWRQGQPKSILEVDEEEEGDQEEDYFINDNDDERTNLIQRTSASKYRSIT